MTPTEVDDQEEPDNGESKVEPNGESEESEEDDMDDDEKQFWEVKKANAKAEGKNWVKVCHAINNQLLLIVSQPLHRKAAATADLRMVFKKGTKRRHGTTVAGHFCQLCM